MAVDRCRTLNHFLPKVAEHTIYHDIESFFWVALYLVIDTFGKSGVYGPGEAFPMKSSILKETGRNALEDLIDKAHKPTVTKNGRRNVATALECGRVVLSKAAEAGLGLKSGRNLVQEDVWRLMAGMYKMIDVMLKALGASGNLLDGMLVNRSKKGVGSNLKRGRGKEVQILNRKQARLSP